MDYSPSFFIPASENEAKIFKAVDESAPQNQTTPVFVPPQIIESIQQNFLSQWDQKGPEQEDRTKTTPTPLSKFSISKMKNEYLQQMKTKVKDRTYKQYVKVMERFVKWGDEYGWEILKINKHDYGGRPFADVVDAKRLCETNIMEEFQRMAIEQDYFKSSTMRASAKTVVKKLIKHINKLDKNPSQSSGKHTPQTPRAATFNQFSSAIPVMLPMRQFHPTFLTPEALSFLQYSNLFNQHHHQNGGSNSTSNNHPSFKNSSFGRFHQHAAPQNHHHASSEDLDSSRGFFKKQRSFPYTEKPKRPIGKAYGFPYTTTADVSSFFKTNHSEYNPDEWRSSSASSTQGHFKAEPIERSARFSSPSPSSDSSSSSTISANVGHKRHRPHLEEESSQEERNHHILRVGGNRRNQMTTHHDQPQQQHHSNNSSARAHHAKRMKLESHQDHHSSDEYSDDETEQIELGWVSSEAQSDNDIENQMMYRRKLEERKLYDKEPFKF